MAGAAPVRDLADAVRAVAEDHDDDDRRFQAIGELGRLSAPGFEAVVDAALDGADDDAFATLVGALRGLALVDSPLAAPLLARGRAIAPGSSSALAAIEALLAIGLRDPERMAPIARGFVARGGNWVWVRGHWDKHRAGKRWRRGEWIQRDDRFEWQADAWLDVPAYPSAPPPAPVVEQPQPARAGYVWVGGFHAWRDGDYVWTPGRWERQKAGRTWVAGQWSLQGDRYVWIEGGWR